MNKQQMETISHGKGFIAALDQSGGSTPKALAAYGVGPEAWNTEEEMFDLVHKMRTRIITSPAFDSNRVLGAILFQRTLDSKVDGLSTAEYLWARRGVVPFLKVDKGLEEEKMGVKLMKPIDDLASIVAQAHKKGVYGTKMRSVIYEPNEEGIRRVVAQQFDYAKVIIAGGLVPIVEPEVDIHAPEKAECERLLKALLVEYLDKLEGEARVMLKLTLPTETGLYSDLALHKHVQRIVALSGGYSLDESCKKLAQNENVIASFSRTLVEGLSVGMTGEEFDARLALNIDKIYRASVEKN